MRSARIVVALALSVCLLGSIASEALAAPIYEQMMDAGWLAANASFSSRTPSLVEAGSVLHFAATGIDNRDYDVLLEVPLTQAGVLPAGATVAIDISATPLSPDNDLKVGITDGTSVVVFERSDNNDGMGRLLAGDRLGPWLPVGIQADMDYSFEMFTNAGMPDEFSAIFTLGQTETSIYGQIGTSTGTATASRLLSRNSPLSLVLLADDDYEAYGINHINVSVVPEPATLSLLALSGLAMLRRRK